MNRKPITEDVVLGIATEQINQNGSTTTLDVKRELRNKGEYTAFQWEISQMMQNLFSQGKLASTNDPNLPFQTYDLPQEPAASTASSTPLATVTDYELQEIVKKTSNPAALWIIQNFKHLLSISRKTVVAQGYTDTQVDSALSSLTKKGVITRIAPGEYTGAQAFISASAKPAVSDTVTSTQAAPAITPEQEIANLSNGAIVLLAESLEKKVKEKALKEVEDDFDAIKNKIKTLAENLESAHTKALEVINEIG